MNSRRDFLRHVSVLFSGGFVLQQGGPPQATPPKLGADPLPYPDAIGQQRVSLDSLDLNPTVISIEHKLHCTCGCTLDIYTCRTTDFTCEVSPRLHQEIRTMVSGGKSEKEIISFFVAREGEKMLMAPPREGFNLAGYLVPGLSVTTAVLILAFYLSRKRKAGALAAVASDGSVSAKASAPDAQQLEQLRKALDELES